MKPLPGTKTFPDEGSNQACRSTHQRLKRSAAPIDRRPPKPLPDQGKEEETNFPDQRGYLPAPLPGDRVRRPSVQNLYMAAKTKLKLFEGTSLRLFTKQTTGTPPSFPANIKELLHEELSDEQQNKAKALSYYPIETFDEDMLRLNCEAFGGYCGGCYPRIPMRRPKAYSPGQGGSGRSNPDGPRQDYLLRKTTGSFPQCRDRIRSSLSSRDTVVIQLGLLPCKPTRTPSCNPAPRVYKGSRGTSLEHPRSDLIRQDTKRL